ncbi:MAG: Heimdall-CTERM domain-containing surface protein [Candidatus Hodarchaeales archaeon]
MTTTFGFEIFSLVISLGGILFIRRKKIIK